MMRCNVNFEQDLKLLEDKILGSIEDIEEFHHKFTYLRPLGEGGFGYVVAARYNLKDKSVVAVKIINKKSSSPDQIKANKWEYKLVSSLNHPKILRNIDCLETYNKIYIVLELMRGGSLRNKIDHFVMKGVEFSEEAMRRIVKQILEGIKYLHDKNVIHRDIKSDNILFERIGDLDSLKIADFGLAYFAESNKMHRLFTKCGTKAYMAPEMFCTTRHYSREVDLWSLGVIIHDMITGGRKIIDIKTDEDLDSLQQKIEILICKLNVSDQLKDLLKRLLAVDPLKRYSAYIALEHPWITQKSGPAPFLLLEKERMFYVKKNLLKLFRIMFIFANIQKSFNVHSKEISNNSSNKRLSTKPNTTADFRRKMVVISSGMRKSKKSNEHSPQIRISQNMLPILQSKVTALQTRKKSSCIAPNAKRTQIFFLNNNEAESKRLTQKRKTVSTTKKKQKCLQSPLAKNSSSTNLSSENKLSQCSNLGLISPIQEFDKFGVREKLKRTYRKFIENRTGGRRGFMYTLDRQTFADIEPSTLKML